LSLLEISMFFVTHHIQQSSLVLFRVCYNFLLVIGQKDQKNWNAKMFDFSIFWNPEKTSEFTLISSTSFLINSDALRDWRRHKSDHKEDVRTTIPVSDPGAPDAQGNPVQLIRHDEPRGAIKDHEASIKSLEEKGKKNENLLNTPWLNSCVHAQRNTEANQYMEYRKEKKGFHHS